MEMIFTNQYNYITNESVDRTMIGIIIGALRITKKLRRQLHNECQCETCGLSISVIPL